MYDRFCKKAFAKNNFKKVSCITNILSFYKYDQFDDEFMIFQPDQIM